MENQPMRNLPAQLQDSQIASRKDVEYVLLPDAREEHETNFLDFLNILKRRKLIVIIISSIILLFGILNAIVEKPVYEATATLLISDANPKVISIQEISTGDNVQSSFNTHLEIIKSRAIAEQVVDVLQLDKQIPEEDSYIVQMIDTIRQFPQRIVSTITKTIDQLFVSKPTKTDNASAMSRDPHERRRQKVIKNLQNKIDAQIRPNTKLIDVTLKDRDPLGAVNQVNTVVSAFINQNFINKLTTSNRAKSWLEKEAGSLKEKINKAELLLEDFTAGKDYIQSDVLGQAPSTAFQRLGSLNTSYVESNNRRLQLEAQINSLKSILNRNIEDMLDFPLITDNSIILPFKKRLLDLQIEYANLANKLKPKHPRMVDLQSNIEETKSTIKAAIQNMINTIQKEYQTLLAQENTLKRELQTQKTEIFGFSGNVREYNALKRDLEINQNLYLEVSRRLAETTLTEALTTNNMHLIEPALTSQLVPSRRVLLVLIHFVFGLGFGAVCALVVDYFDKRFKTADEVEGLLEIPFLGFIPHDESYGRSGGPIALQEPGSSTAEAYRTLRTWLTLSTRRPLKTLLITSASPDEGKTTTAVNLAISFAQLGQMVLLVDTDLRRPSLYRHFAPSNQAGLANILMDGTEWDQVVQATALENLKIIAHGGRPSNPVELFSTTRMKHFIASTKRAFDIVIFDSPMALSIPDVAILAPEMDGVLLVHHPRQGNKDVVLEAKKLIERTGAALVGVVLNNVRQKDIGFYSPYRYQNYYAYSATESSLGQNGSEFIEMKPLKNTKAWVSDAFHPSVPAKSLPISIEATSRSANLSITIGDIHFLDDIGGQSADINMHFLMLDLTLTNYANSPYVFYPTMTSIITNERNDYDTTLMALNELQYGIGENEAAVSVNIYNYNPKTTQIERGMAQDEFILPNSTSKGSIAFQVPLEAGNFIFKYVDTMTTITIPFKIPKGNNHA
jgi:polysaccharide biosynthesis transport protein